MKFLSRCGEVWSLNYIYAMPKTRSKLPKSPASPSSSDLHARRSREKADEAAAWREYHASFEDLTQRTVRLRALRLSRENSQKRKKPIGHD